MAAAGFFALAPEMKSAWTSPFLAQSCARFAYCFSSFSL